jgi:hypothetical protein
MQAYVKTAAVTTAAVEVLVNAGALPRLPSSSHINYFLSAEEKYLLHAACLPRCNSTIRHGLSGWSPAAVDPFAL